MITEIFDTNYTLIYDVYQPTIAYLENEGYGGAEIYKESMDNLTIIRSNYW